MDRQEPNSAAGAAGGSGHTNFSFEPDADMPEGHELRVRDEEVALCDPLNQATRAQWEKEVILSEHE